MPLPNFHSFRLIAPEKVSAYRTAKNKFGSGIDAIFGILKDGGKVEIASVHFDADKFTFDEAKKWMEEHKYKPIESVRAKEHASMRTTVEHLQVAFASGPIDRTNGVIRGLVVAEKGPFRNEDRGEFDDAAIGKIADLMNAQPDGVISHLQHPGASGTYPIGSYLGRKKNARVEDGKVKVDLLFNKTAMEPGINGGKPLADYIMTLAETDPKAIGSSLVLSTEKQYRKGKSPLWQPLEIHGSDLVDAGECVRSLLSYDSSYEDRVVAAYDTLNEARKWLLIERVRQLREFCN